MGRRPNPEGGYNALQKIHLAQIPGNTSVISIFHRQPQAFFTRRALRQTNFHHYLSTPGGRTERRLLGIIAGRDVSG